MYFGTGSTVPASLQAGAAKRRVVDQLGDLGYEAVRVDVNGLHATAADRHFTPLAWLGVNLTQGGARSEDPNRPRARRQPHPPPW
jgi:hypothetical protein